MLFSPPVFAGLAEINNCRAVSVNGASEKILSGIRLTFGKK